MKRLVLWLLVMLFYTSAGAQDFKAYRGTVPGSYNFWFHDPEGGSHKDPKAHFPLLIFFAEWFPSGWVELLCIRNG